ncbi:MAG: DUF368 domain-containing protein [Saprospiraceae bacterium]|nr:DUF368 domain-containing protein [Saprospiraceae bacterium]
MNHNLLTSLKGLAMGMAEVVPGVSGGTIAFITGIYERLIFDIKKITRFPLGIWKYQGFKVFWEHIDGTFLFSLLTGMVLGILVGVLGISYLLEFYPSIIWGFFFGLIIASAIYIARKITRWTYVEILAALIGTAIAYYITIISPTQGTDNLMFVFVSGMIAICALILPGISGSFILLLMGMYTIVLHNAKEMISERSTSSMLLILVFLLGCGVGITLFSNVLNYLFKRFYQPTLALLTGFMIGSLNRIWPWRNPVVWLDKESGGYVNIIPPGSDLHLFQVVQEMNVLPNNYEGTAYLPVVIVCFVLGLVIVWLLDRNDQGQRA